MTNEAANDVVFMLRARALAERARSTGEVPVGAVVVYEGKVIGEGWNQPIARHDPSAHAEMLALREAALHLNNYRLTDTTLYVTLEPCAMCAGAIVHARVKRLVFGASDPRAGAAGSVFNIVQNEALNHRLIVSGGLMADECATQLKAFFQSRRNGEP